MWTDCTAAAEVGWLVMAEIPGQQLPRSILVAYS